MSEFPRPNKSFNPMAYRSMVAYNAHLASLKEDQAKEQDSSQLQQSHPTAQQPTGTSTTQSSHPEQSSASKKGKEVDSDPPHYMSDAEVKQWYIDADREYEERKKTGYNKDYVPAGGHPPDLISRAFNKEERGGAKPTKGLASSMHAPKTQEKKAGQSSKKEDKDRSDAPPNTGAW